MANSEQLKIFQVTFGSLDKSKKNVDRQYSASQVLEIEQLRVSISLHLRRHILSRFEYAESNCTKAATSNGKDEALFHKYATSLSSACSDMWYCR